MADVEIQSCLFDQNFTHIVGYKNKNNRPKENPSSIRRTIIYKISDKNFKPREKRVYEVRWVSKAQNGYIFTIFFLYTFNETFYSNSLPYKRYIFDRYFVKFLLKNFENSVIGTSSPVTLQKKFSQRSQDNS